MVFHCFGVVSPNPAFANSDPAKLEAPHYAIGGGVGFTGLVHID